MNNTLQHHGVKGMKWGVRHDYKPIGGWRNKSLDKGEESNHTNSKSHKLTDKQKRAIKIGAAAVGTTLAAYGMYRLKKSGKLDSLINKGKSHIGKNKVGSADDFWNSKVSDLSNQNKPASDGGIKRLAKPESLAETLKNVNPHRGDPAYKDNCSLCSIASVLRQRGFDVKAGKTGGQQNLGGIVEECFKNAKVVEGSAVKFGRSRKDAAEMLVRRFGDNAEGVVGIKWSNADRGHAFNWQIRNGKVSFFDGQKNCDDSIINKYWDRIDQNGYLTLARLDNLDIRESGVRRWLE